MGKVSSFLVGGMIGAGIALAFAPKTGEQTRAFVAEKATAVAGEAKDFSAGLPENIQDVVKNVSEQGAALLKDAQGKTGDIVADASTKVKEATGRTAEADQDELREKIEAARKRIAAQVMENAELAQEAAADAADKTEETKHAAM